MVEGSKWFDRMFPIVEASKLSLEDKFLKYEPETCYQERVKETLIDGIKAGLKDFRKPAMSLLADKFAYEVGLSPVTGRSCYWWHENAKRFMPEKNSRLGTETEYAAFLGLVITFFINEMEYTVSEAWNAVCNFRTREVVKYLNSKVAKRSELIGLLCELQDIDKVLMSEHNGYIYSINKDTYNMHCEGCLIDGRREDCPNPNYDNSVGWIVIDA